MTLTLSTATKMELEKNTPVSWPFSLYAARRLRSITPSSGHPARHLQASIAIPMTTPVEAQRWRSRLFVDKT